MKAYRRVSGRVRIDLPDSYEIHVRAVDFGKSLIVSHDEFEELAAQIRHGDVEKGGDETVLDAVKRELEALRDRLSLVQQERDALRLLQHTEPARMVIHTTAAERSDWESSDLATADVLAKIAATAPVGSLVDDLKNTIVSQAREIARLKGEGE